MLNVNKPALGGGIFLMLLSALCWVVVIVQSYRGHETNRLTDVAISLGCIGCTSGGVACLLVALEEELGAHMGRTYLYYIALACWVTALINFFSKQINSDFERWFIVIGVFGCLCGGSILSILASGCSGAVESGIFHAVLAVSCWVFIFIGQDDSFYKVLVMAGLIIFTSSGACLLVFARKFKKHENSKSSD